MSLSPMGGTSAFDPKRHCHHSRHPFQVASETKWPGTRRSAHSSEWQRRELLATKTQGKHKFLLWYLKQMMEVFFVVSVLYAQMCWTPESFSRFVLAETIYAKRNMGWLVHDSIEPWRPFCSVGIRWKSQIGTDQRDSILEEASEKDCNLPRNYT